MTEPWFLGRTDTTDTVKFADIQLWCHTDHERGECESIPIFGSRCYNCENLETYVEREE